MSTPLKIVKKQTHDLKPYLKNARTHPKKQIDQIAASISEFGFNNPILIAEDGEVIAGHGRLAAAVKLGMESVPCIVLPHLTDDQRRAYVLADNKLAENSGWDPDMLRDELSALAAVNFNIDLVGFDASELNKILTPDTGADGRDADEEMVPTEGVPVSKLGDVWILGDHRLICGDSTDKATVEKLMAGAKPNLMVTDPPYGVEYDASFRSKIIDPRTGKNKTVRAEGKVLNDDRADWKAAWECFTGNIAYVWHAGCFAGVVQNSLEVCGFKTRAQIIWAKSNFAIGRGDYHWQHEPCWYAVRKGGNWTGDRKQTTVWNIDKPQKSETGHSTQKPIECMERPIRNNSSVGDYVYDPFGGSGTTLIAAERTSRKCLMIELNPAYVDLIVRRWEGFTGKKAVHQPAMQEAA